MFDSQHAAAAADASVMMMSDAGVHQSSMSPGADIRQNIMQTGYRRGYVFAGFGVL